MWVITFDSIEQVRTVNEIAVGGYHELDIPIPALLAAVLLAGTDRFMVAHNHPSGDIMPTAMDVEMTRIVMTAANAAGLMFEDHLITGPKGGLFSLAEHGLLIPSAKSTAMAQGAGHKRAQIVRA
jgi:DNA repair protein RadC